MSGQASGLNVEEYHQIEAAAEQAVQEYRESLLRLEETREDVVEEEQMGHDEQQGEIGRHTYDKVHCICSTDI